MSQRVRTIKPSLVKPSKAMGKVYCVVKLSAKKKRVLPTYGTATQVIRGRSIIKHDR
jgi:hypothetical protein